MIWELLAAVTVDSATLCVRDARRDMPIAGVQAVDSAGRTSSLARSCARIRTGRWTLRRIGYRSAHVLIGQSDSVVTVFMTAIADAPVLLETSRVRANRLQGSGAGIARMTATIDVDSARALGIESVSGLISSMPFASPRGARGDVGLSLRGARREGVVVTLDGMALNDPSTGTADISDIPLVLLSSANLSLGADPLGAGPGASGGVLSLQSAVRQQLSVHAGAFGAHAVEGAYRGTAGGALLSGSASYRGAHNDFPFVNDAGAEASQSMARERRVNNDERRGALSAAASSERAHALVLLSASERGMVGPANVRTYDADRAQTMRALVRMQAAVGGASVAAGARVLTLAYRDPTRRELDSDARTVAADVDASGMLRAFSWRVGAGGDGVTATGNLRQSRGRAFGALSREGSVNRGVYSLGARIDAIGAFGALPSFSVALQRALVRGDARTLSFGARIAQAVRVPTLYDLYFSSPQRLFVRTLRPERVALDAEVNVAGDARIAAGIVEAQVAFVTRDVRDAIVWFPGNFGFSPQNVGVERLRGVESRASVRHRAASVSAWLTAYDTDLSVGGLRIPTPYVASVNGGGGLAATLAGFTASANVRASGRRPYTAGPRNPEFELPAVALLDVALSRSFPLGGARALSAFSIDNVTAASWQQVRGFPSPGRAWALSLTLSPQPSQ